jgi:hypothetical protein
MPGKISFPRKSVQAMAAGRGQSFCRTSEALRRVCRKHVGTIDPVAATLAALPEWIEERAAAAEAPDRIGGAAE